MKELKLYNLIFPIWFLLFLPPVILITLTGNFIIDSVVIIICFYTFKLSSINIELKSFYKNSVLKVWLFGFLADIIGAVILFIVSAFGHEIGISDKLISAVNYNPYENVFAVILIIFAMLVSSFFIYLFNYKYTFKKLIKDNLLRLKVSLTIAIVTAPWTFLLPTKWFYYHGI